MLILAAAVTRRWAVGGRDELAHKPNRWFVTVLYTLAFTLGTACFVYSLVYSFYSLVYSLVHGPAPTWR